MSPVHVLSYYYYHYYYFYYFYFLLLLPLLPACGHCQCIWHHRCRHSCLRCRAQRHAQPKHSYSRQRRGRLHGSVPSRCVLLQGCQRGYTVPATAVIWTLPSYLRLLSSCNKSAVTLCRDQHVSARFYTPPCVSVFSLCFSVCFLCVSIHGILG